jgi:hypothetical protein
MTDYVRRQDKRSTRAAKAKVHNSGHRLAVARQRLAKVDKGRLNAGKRELNAWLSCSALCAAQLNAQLSK